MPTRFTEVRVTTPSPVTAEDLTTAAALAAKHFTDGACYLRLLEPHPGGDGAPEQTDIVFTARQDAP